MINRILIRIKVVQILYSYFLKEDKNMGLTENYGGSCLKMLL